MLIKMISDHIARDSNSQLNQDGLTLSQLRYLEFLTEHGDAPVYFKEFESHFQASQPTVSGIMRRMEGKGLIRIKAAERGRAKMAELTETGRKWTENARISREKEEAKLLYPLNEEERKLFQEMLLKICRHMEQ